MRVAGGGAPRAACAVAGRWGRGLTIPEGGGLPVVVVVGEAGEAGQAALVPLPLALLLLALLPPPPVLLEELQLAVHFLRRLPVGTEGAAVTTAKRALSYRRRRPTDSADTPYEAQGQLVLFTEAPPTPWAVRANPLVTALSLNRTDFSFLVYVSTWAELNVTRHPAPRQPPLLDKGLNSLMPLTPAAGGMRRMRLEGF